jgi:hypothetical protein
MKKVPAQAMKKNCPEKKSFDFSSLDTIRFSSQLHYAL